MKHYKIHTKTFGKGNNIILFLHGYGGSINSFLHIANVMAEDNKVILVDFFGFGKTPYPNDVIDAYECATQIYLLLKKRKINTLNIVAHSYGGRVAIILASIFDITITKLALIASAGIKPKRNLSYYFKIYKYKLAKKLVQVKLLAKNKLSKYGSDEYKKLNNLQKISYSKVVNQDLTYLLKYIKAQTLIVWGTKDKSTPLYMSKVLQKNILNSGVFLYTNSSHFCYLENLAHFLVLIHTFFKKEK